MKTYTAHNVGVIEYEYREAGQYKTEISYIRAQFMDGRVLESDNLQDFLTRVTNEKVALLFVWDFNFFGAFLDYYCFTHGIELYDKDNVERSGKNKTWVAQECFSALYTRRGMLNLKLTLRRSKGTHRHNLDKSKASYHTTEFRGLEGYFGGCNLERAVKGCGVPATATKTEALLMLLDYLQKAYKTIMDIDFLSYSFLSRTYTVGRAARDLYLKMRYGKPSLLAYKREHRQNQGLDNYMRERRLLLGGMCITNLKSEGVLLHRKAPNCIRKYDKNGLYSHVANKCGELGYPQNSSMSEFLKDVKGEYAYIIVFKRLSLYLKKGKPRVFSHPFDATQDISVEIDTEYAMWGELYHVLGEYYDIELADVLRVYKCKKIDDPYMQKYNAHLLKFKDIGRANGDKALYTIAKIFLNGLLGKFSQHTKVTKQVPYYDSDSDMVRFELVESTDEWDKKHFDFIRGSYIYSLARVEMLADMLKLFRAKKMSAHHFYTDTDSIVTDIVFPDEYVSQTELGKYKVEESYQDFGVMCRKLYYGRTVNGEDKLTCAGLPKRDVLDGIAKAFPAGLSAQDYFNYINSDNGMDLHVSIRCRGGSIVTTQKYTLNYVRMPLEF